MADVNNYSKNSSNKHSHFFPFPKTTPIPISTHSEVQAQQYFNKHSPLSSSITPSLFHSRLKTFLFCKSFPPQPTFSSFGLTPRIRIPLTVYRYFGAYPFLLFTFSVLHFLVVGSVRQMKLTHVGFRAHVKIASRIVSWHTGRPGDIVGEGMSLQQICFPHLAVENNRAAINCRVSRTIQFPASRIDATAFCPHKPWHRACYTTDRLLSVDITQLTSLLARQCRTRREGKD